MANEELKMDIYSDIYEIDTKDWITKSNTIIESTYNSPSKNKGFY